MMDEQLVRQWIIRYLSEFLGVPETRIVPNQGFDTYGLDSADAIIVGGALEDHFDVEIDATLFLRNDTIDELVADLRQSGLLK